MATNMIQPGDKMVVAAPAAVDSGDGVQVGQIFGVAEGAAAQGASVVLCLTGIWELDKVGSQAWTVGALVYWDDGNSRCTTVADGSLLIGVAAAAVGDGAGATRGQVRLNGSFRANEPSN